MPDIASDTCIDKDNGGHAEPLSCQLHPQKQQPKEVPKEVAKLFKTPSHFNESSPVILFETEYFQSNDKMIG